MSAIASQITSLTIVYSTVYPGADQSKHQSSASLAFVWGIRRGPVNSPHKWPVTRKMFPFDDVIMKHLSRLINKTKLFNEAISQQIKLHVIYMNYATQLAKDDLKNNLNDFTTCIGLIWLISYSAVHSTCNCYGKVIFAPSHDDVLKWKHSPRNWPFVRGIHRSPVNFPHKGQLRGALMFSFICAWINTWVNNCEVGDLRRHHAHYDVIVMKAVSIGPSVKSKHDYLN